MNVHEFGYEATRQVAEWHRAAAFDLSRRSLGLEYYPPRAC